MWCDVGTAFQCGTTSEIRVGLPVLVGPAEFLCVQGTGQDSEIPGHRG